MKGLRGHLEPRVRYQEFKGKPKNKLESGSAFFKNSFKSWERTTSSYKSLEIQQMSINNRRDSAPLWLSSRLCLELGTRKGSGDRPVGPEDPMASNLVPGGYADRHWTQHKVAKSHDWIPKSCVEPCAFLPTLTIV